VFTFSWPSISQGLHRQSGCTGENVVCGWSAVGQGERIEQLPDSAEGEVLLERLAAGDKNVQASAAGECGYRRQQRCLPNARRTIDDDEASPRPLRVRDAALEEYELPLTFQEGADLEIAR
jgi:hypothetical protein